MSHQMSAMGGGGLERLCKPASLPDAVSGSAIAGIERMHMAIGGDEAFSPHRHDTLAVGVTLRGVQTFAYRGEQRLSLPGDVHVLAPDELHDGAPGTESGFEYRIVYVEPALLIACLGTGAQSFRRDPIYRQPVLDAEQRWLLWGTPGDGDALERTDAIAALARLLDLRPAKSARALPLEQMNRVREALDAGGVTPLQMRELEAIAGIDRWSIARGFRQVYGTSPSRYRIMRRLADARRLILAGSSFAQAAHGAGFADQSHFNRQFKAAYGLTPGLWMHKLAISPAVPLRG